MAVYTIQALGGPPNAVAVGLNSSGNTCGDWEPSQFYGETWAPAGQVSLALEIPCYLTAIDDHSEGGFYDTVGALGNEQNAILVRAGQIVDLVRAFGVGTEATVINNNGLIAGYNQTDAIVYDSFGNNVVATIPPPPGANRIAAMAINSSGAIAGMISNNKA